MFDSRDRKQLNCLRDHKKRITWTGEFYDQSYQRRPTDQEVPRLKLLFIDCKKKVILDTKKGSFSGMKLSVCRLEGSY